MNENIAFVDQISDREAKQSSIARLFLVHESWLSYTFAYERWQLLHVSPGALGTRTECHRDLHGHHNRTPITTLQTLARFFFGINLGWFKTFTSMVYVDPLSDAVFLKLLATYPDLDHPAYREAVKTVTNCVPRELEQLSNFIGQSSSAETIGRYESWRKEEFQQLAEENYSSLKDEYFKTKFTKALLDSFLGGTRNTNFQWNFLDLGMVYRRIRPGGYEPTFYILCPPAQRTLLQLFKSMPLPEDIRNCLKFGIKLTGEQFEQALFQQLLRSPQPIMLTSTDLNNKNKQSITLDFDRWDTIKPGCVSLGPDHKRTLSRGYDNYPRFDYMVGPIFIQVSVTDFATHNKSSAKIQLAEVANLIRLKPATIDKKPDDLVPPRMVRLYMGSESSIFMGHVEFQPIKVYRMPSGPT
jgi:hypothetical protein